MRKWDGAFTGSFPTLWYAMVSNLSINGPQSAPSHAPMGL